MELLSLRSFTTEMVKIALEIKDPDIRALLADRKGKEYLQGGQLPSNSPSETHFVPKLAAKKGLGSLDPMATPLDQMRVNTKGPGRYQSIRDTVLTGLGGATAGAGINRWTERLRGLDVKHSPRSYALSMGIGAGIGIGDRYMRHRSENVKQAMIGSDTFSPGRALESSSDTGKFMSKVHKGAVVKPTGLVGRIGRLPTV